MHRIELPLVLALSSASLFAQSAPVAAQPPQPPPQADRSKAQAADDEERAQKSEPDVWLGLSVQPRKDGAPRLEILEVIPGSPASRAAIQSGDVLVSLAGKAVKTHDSLLELLRDRRPGERVRLTVERSRSIALGESTEADHHALLGVTTSNAKNSDGSGKQGLPTSAVSKQSAAESADFAVGDRICAIDGHELTTSDELHKLIRAHKPGDKVEVRTQRDVEVELGQRPDQADGNRSVTGMGGRAFGAGGAGTPAPKDDGKGLFTPDSKPGDLWTAPAPSAPRAVGPQNPPAQPPRKLQPGAPVAKKRAPAPGNPDQSNLAQLLDEIRALRGEVADLRREISKLRLEREARQDAAPKARGQLR